MKNIISILLFSICVVNVSARNSRYSQVTPAEQVYNRMVISSRIVEFTEAYINSKKANKPNVPNSIWETVKNNIDYTNFKNKVIVILNNNLSEAGMQRMLSEFSQTPLIPIPTINIKKEISDLMPVFYGDVDTKISQILSNNGYKIIVE